MYILQHKTNGTTQLNRVFFKHQAIKNNIYLLSTWFNKRKTEPNINSHLSSSVPMLLSHSISFIVWLVMNLILRIILGSSFRSTESYFQSLVIKEMECFESTPGSQRFSPRKNNNKVLPCKFKSLMCQNIQSQFLCKDVQYGFPSLPHANIWMFSIIIS